MQKEVADELQVRLNAAEEALAAKQDKIDAMKQDIFQKEKEMETISVFQAQVRVLNYFHFKYFKCLVMSRMRCSFTVAIMLFFCSRLLSAGGGLLLRLLRRASGEGETPRGEGATGCSAGVCEEAEHPAAGRDGLTGKVRNGKKRTKAETGKLKVIQTDRSFIHWTVILHLLCRCM